MGSLLSWIKTNSSVGSGGSDPATIGVSTRTDGTQRTFTEALLKTVVAEVFESGGSPKILMVGSAGKQKVSTFAGIAQQRYMAPSNTPTTIIGAADVYFHNYERLSKALNLKKGVKYTQEDINKLVQENSK